MSYLQWSSGSLPSGTELSQAQSLEPEDYVARSVAEWALIAEHQIAVGNRDFAEEAIQFAYMAADNRQAALIRAEMNRATG